MDSEGAGPSSSNYQAWRRQDPTWVDQGNQHSQYQGYTGEDYENDLEFANRIKTIRTKAETFSKCTGEEVLIVALDNKGGCHHWGTPCFEKFMNDRRVQELIYKHMTEPPSGSQTVLNDTHVEAEHLRALLSQKMQLRHKELLGVVASDAPIYAEPAMRPEEWPEDIVFTEPVNLSHAQLLTILKRMAFKEKQEEEVEVDKGPPPKPLPPVITIDAQPGGEKRVRPQADDGSPMPKRAATGSATTEVPARASDAPAGLRLKKMPAQELLEAFELARTSLARKQGQPAPTPMLQALGGVPPIAPGGIAQPVDSALVMQALAAARAAVPDYDPTTSPYEDA